MTNNEELIGGCCVCSDDQGFSNNVLVYCDGKGCTVACHTACYGIVSIPEGDWYCRRCEAGELESSSCRLCPITEGAMKRTSDGGWAHVICALYIPEVSFENNTTMEPIILSKIPLIRYEQICSICIKNGRTKSEAMKGACCECTIKNCSEIFHVTCAQQAGYLYEDIRKNNCQYPIYCQQHQPKFSKFIRQIPPFQYKSFEQKHNIKDKINPSQLSDFVKQINKPSVERKSISNDETSQNSIQIINSLNNLSQFIELNQNQSIIDNSNSTSICTTENVNNLPLNKSFTQKIKTEENEIDYQIVEKPKLNKNNQLHKKRQHSIESGGGGVPRPVGRPPSKKKLNNNNSSISPSQTTKTDDRIRIDFFPRRPLTTTPTINSQRSFPPETLEEFLEQEWETSSDFLLQQSMPQDVSSLLSCLYQFKSENTSLQKKFDDLKHRRDSLHITNVNLRRKLSEIYTINDSLCLPTKSISKSNKITSSDIEYFSTNSTISPYTMIKNERLPSTNGISLELLSQILTTNSSQLFAPTWNISNFGYANFSGANSISISDESILRSYSSFDQ